MMSISNLIFNQVNKTIEITSFNLNKVILDLIEVKIGSTTANGGKSPTIKSDTSSNIRPILIIICEKIPSVK